MKKEIKIGIVGMGRVGAAIAYNIGIKELANKIYAIDNNAQLAQAQVDDLQASFIIENSKTKIEVNNYENIESVDILIITASVASTVNRLESYDQNYLIMEEVVKNATYGGFKGIYVIASNPVDVMTSVVHRKSGASYKKVIGTGTILDNARLQYELGNELNVDYKNISSSCIGEHGESIVPLYSEVTINGKELNEHLKDNNLILNYNKLTQAVINGGPKIFIAKGATEFGIASSTTKIVNAIINNTNEQLLVSSSMYIDKIGDVFIPALANVNKNGVDRKTLSNLSQSEYKKFVTSAKIINSYNKAD